VTFGEITGASAGNSVGSVIDIVSSVGFHD
jgi:hypothetical protein